ncbi:MAG: NYN domain-containing protein [Candidatus Aerophobetes bacterium]|nr:NYN domain-containing protein [Candidatus Aerophobetes bacterium]
MRVAILVDGYNTIYQSPSLKNLLKKSLHQAQEELIRLVSNYCSFKERKGYIIFDAYRQPSFLDVEEEITSGVKVVITGRGKTADSYIERFIFRNKSSYDYIYIVTSDYSQGMTVMDTKIFPLSPRNFLKEVKSCQKELLMKAHSSISSRKFNPRLSDYLKDEMREKLKEIGKE